MFEKTKASIKIKKAIKLVDILEQRGTINKDEKLALIEISSLYFYGGIRKKEELIDYINGFYDFLYSSSREEERLKSVRRASTRLAFSISFRERLLGFCLDYFIPFLNKKSFFEIYRLYKEEVEKKQAV